MRRFLPLAFLLAVPSQWLLWTIAWVTMPHPYFIAGLLLCSLLGGGWSIVTGSIRSTGYGMRGRGLLIVFGLLVLAGGAGFLYAVLSNSDGEIEVLVQRPAVAGPVTQLRILNLNVLHGFPDFPDQEKRFQRTITELAGINADVLVLQEAWSTTQHGCMADRLAKRLGLNYAYARANGSQTLIGFEEGSAILSRYPLKNARRVLLRPREPFWENRLALLVDIDLGGDFVTIAGVHLSTSIPDAQANHLLSGLRTNELLFVAGDFNAKPKSGAIDAMVRAGLTRVVPTENRVYFQPGIFNVMAEPLPEDPIDHLFLGEMGSRKWATEQAVQVETSRYIQPCIRFPISDHDAIVVDLRRR